VQIKRIIIPILLIVVALIVWRLNLPKEFRYAGTLEATEVDISPRLPAPLLTLPSPEGSPVVTGQILARLDGEDLRLAADQAARDYARAIRLNKNGSLPVEALERYRFRKEETALRLSWCTIVSPLDGVVLRRYHEPGEWVTPGQKILTLANLRELYAYVYVPAPVMEKLAINQTVSALLPFAKTKSKTGKIVSIRNEAEFTPKNVQTQTERERLVFGIKVVFENTDGALKPGMSVEITF
jgi:HlyD family secretion protein